MKRLFIFVFSLLFVTLFFTQLFAYSAISDCEEGFVYGTLKGQKYFDVCNSKNTDLSYHDSYYRTFYVSGHQCGINCDLNGRNCDKMDFDKVIGICNPADCPNGYKNLAYYAAGVGMCKNEHGKDVLLKQGNGSFINAKEYINNYKKLHGFNLGHEIHNFGCLMTFGSMSGC